MALSRTRRVIDSSVTLSPWSAAQNNLWLSRNSSHCQCWSHWTKLYIRDDTLPLMPCGSSSSVDKKHHRIKYVTQLIILCWLTVYMVCHIPKPYFLIATRKVSSWVYHGAATRPDLTALLDLIWHDLWPHPWPVTSNDNPWPLCPQVHVLERQVTVLAENQNNNDDRYTRSKEENAALQARLIMLEEQVGNIDR